jgi:hypothetical protein
VVPSHSQNPGFMLSHAKTKNIKNEKNIMLIAVIKNKLFQQKSFDNFLKKFIASLFLIYIF